MRRKRFFVEQIVAVLKQAELGLPMADLIRQIGISKQTFYRWKWQYAGLESDQVRELEQVAEENGRLKKLVADLRLDKTVQRDILLWIGAQSGTSLRSELSLSNKMRRSSMSADLSAFSAFPPKRPIFLFIGKWARRSWGLALRANPHPR